MISHKHKCIFIHIIKTGGTSIERFFKKGTSHAYSKDYKKKINIKTWSSYFKFTFVRNPWDKMVSQYFYIQRNKKQSYKSTFREFILAFKNCPENKHIRGNKIPVTYNPVQLPWILDDQGNCLVDFIGRFENLQEDFEVVCNKIGIKPAKLPHKNKSKHKYYAEYYDDETRQVVAQKYAKDIEFFGYHFGD